MTLRCIIGLVSFKHSRLILTSVEDHSNNKTSRGGGIREAIKKETITTVNNPSCEKIIGLIPDFWLDSCVTFES